MILRMPEYCKDFKCSADKCSDSCCAGWEIDIDENTAEYYMSVSGDFGERLKRGISADDGYSFILNGERCPFLNERNLCDIILELGEDKLCRICAEHPRYYEWYDGAAEGGVGLCCEEAARLILERGGGNGYFESEIPDEECDSYDKELYDCLFEAREKIFALLKNKEIPLYNAVNMLLSFACDLQSRIDSGQLSQTAEMTEGFRSEITADTDGILKIFGGLEPIDEKWLPFVSRMGETASLCAFEEPYEEYMRNIGIYFIWRYFLKGVFDEEIISKVKLSVMSMAMARIMFGSEEKPDLLRSAELMKNYSKEIEYSEENMEALYDMTYTEPVLSEESLISFFK